MKKIKAPGWLFLCGCCLAVLVCSRSPFDPSTGLGQQVIDATYPDAVDLQHAFKAVSLGCAVSHDTSIRFDANDASDSIRPGVHERGIWSGVYDNGLTVGSLSGERSVAYMEFRTAPLRGSVGLPGLRAARDSGTLDSMYLKLSYALRPSDTVGGPATISVDTCPIKKRGVPFDTTLLGSQGMWTFQVQRDTFADTTTMVTLDTGFYLPIIKRAIDTAASAVDTDSVAFCLRMRDVARVFRPSSAQLIISYRYLPDTTRRIEAIPISFAEYTVFEPAVSPDTGGAVSSWESDRFVEVKLDLSALWDSAVNAQIGKSYAVVQAAYCSLSTGSSVIEPQTDSVPVLYGILDHTLDNKLSAEAMRDSLKTLFSVGRLSRAWVVPSSRDLSVSCTGFLQRLSEERATVKTGYLYLFTGGFPQWARVHWNVGPSVRFNVLFTNPQK
jgi:hypothetical protein